MAASGQLLQHSPTALGRSRDDGDGVAGGGQARGNQSPHLAGAGDEHARRAIEPVQHPRSAAIGERTVSAGHGVAPNATPEAQGSPKELVQDRPGGVVGERRLVRVACLAQELLLRDDCGIEPGDDLEHAPDRTTAAGGAVALCVWSRYSARMLDGHQLDPMARFEQHVLGRADRRERLGDDGTLVDRPVAEGREPDANLVENRGLRGHCRALTDCAS